MRGSHDFIEKLQRMMDEEKEQFREHGAKRAANDIATIRADIYDLCADIIRKQVANQLHIPDGWEGVKEIKTAAYRVKELSHSDEGRCMSVVKADGEWHVCGAHGGKLPLSRLSVDSLLQVKDALLEVYANIIDWEKQWE